MTRLGTGAPGGLGPHADTVLAMLMSGRSQPEVATHLHISRHTCGHICHALRRAHGADTIALMLAALHEADKAALRAEVVLLERTVARMAQGERRRGERRIGPE